MPSDICTTDGCNNPRMVSKSGKQLTKCEDCQRAYWRNRKRDEHGYKPRTSNRGAKSGNFGSIKKSTKPTRKCKQCKKKKPLDAFAPWGNNSRKRTCKACDGIANPKTKSAKKDGNHVLLVNGDTLVLAKIVSQADVQNKALLVDIYREQGYQIENVYESESLPWHTK